jgi:hypothetical protein
MKPSVSFVARSDEDKTWGVLGDVDHLLSCTEARPFCPRSPPSFPGRRRRRRRRR